MTTLSELPTNLPIPLDDGACNHLEGMRLPNISLTSTSGEEINFFSLTGLTVIYIYPMTGRPNVSLPDGWDQIPGARGCTPQACSFRDHYEELNKFNAAVYGLSTQSTSYQQEVVERLHLPFNLLSDESLKFTMDLSLPTFEVEGKTLIRRITLICDNGAIFKVFYPVLPPDQSARNVIDYLDEQVA